MPSERLRQRVADLPWPSTEPTENDATIEPIPGDLWAATWEGTRALVFVLSATVPTIEVCAASTPMTGNDHTVIVSEEQSPIPDAAVHLWANLCATLHRRALDQRLGSAPQLVDVVTTATVEPTGSFPPIADARDPRAEEQARLEDDLAALAHARWQPDIHEPLRELIPTIRPGQLAQLTGIDPGAADQVLDGQLSLTDEQAAAVAAAYAINTTQVVRAAIPRVADNVVSLFDTPSRLRALRRRARREGLTEPEAMLEIAVPLARQAARTTGHAERDWEALIDDALRD